MLNKFSLDEKLNNSNIYSDYQEDNHANICMRFRGGPGGGRGPGGRGPMGGRPPIGGRPPMGGRPGGYRPYGGFRIPTSSFFLPFIMGRMSNMNGNNNNYNDAPPVNAPNQESSADSNVKQSTYSQKTYTQTNTQTKQTTQTKKETPKTEYTQKVSQVKYNPRPKMAFFGLRFLLISLACYLSLSLLGFSFTSIAVAVVAGIVTGYLVEIILKAVKHNQKFKYQSNYKVLSVFLAIAVGVIVLEQLIVFNATIFAVPFVALGSAFTVYNMTSWIFKERDKQLPKEEKVKEPKVAKVKPEKEEKIKKSNTGNLELDKLIDEGNEYIAKLKTANKAIPQEGISESISRMEKASKGIFKYIEKNPSKMPLIRRFMNYYLPTTLKLLDKYKTLNENEVKGDNINSTLFDIEGMMYTVANAFEKQLDSLYGSDYMDIQADISVFEDILEQEGLKDNKNKL